MKVDLVLVYYNNENLISIVSKYINESSALFHKIIIVNNGSTDKTKSLLSQNFQDKNKFQFVNLKKNIHLGGAIKVGISKSTVNTVGWCHGDLIIKKNDYRKFISKIKQISKDGKQALIKGIRVNRKDYLDKFFALCSGIYASILFRKIIYDISGIPVFFCNLNNKNLFVNAPNDYTFHFFIYYFCIINKINIFRVETTLINPPSSHSNWSRNLTGYAKIIFIWLKSFNELKNNSDIFKNEKNKN